MFESRMLHAEEWKRGLLTFDRWNAMEVSYDSFSDSLCKVTKEGLDWKPLSALHTRVGAPWPIFQGRHVNEE
jgi:hypothetical protein